MNRTGGPIGLMFSETMKGKVGGKTLQLDLTISIDDIDVFRADPDHTADVISGAIMHIGTPIPDSTEEDWEQYVSGVSGVFHLFNLKEDGIKHLEYEIDFGDYLLHGTKNIQDNSGPDMLKDITTLYVTLTNTRTGEKSEGEIYFDPWDFPDLLFDSVEVTGTHSLIEKTKAHYKFLEVCFGEMAKEYILNKINQAFK